MSADTSIERREESDSKREVAVMPELKSVMTTSTTESERTLIVKGKFGISMHVLIQLKRSIRLLSCFMIQ
jgi:hypothetical protein